MRDSSTFSGEGASPWRVQPTRSGRSPDSRSDRVLPQPGLPPRRGHSDHRGAPMTRTSRDPVARRADGTGRPMLSFSSRSPPTEASPSRYLEAMVAIVIVVFVGFGLMPDRSSSPPSSSVGATAQPVSPAAPPHRSDARLCPQRPSDPRRGLRCQLGCFPCRLLTGGAETSRWSPSDTRSCSTVANRVALLRGA